MDSEPRDNIPDSLQTKILDDMVKRSPQRLSLEEERKLSMSESDQNDEPSGASTHRHRHCGTCTCTIDARRDGESLDAASARRKAHQLDYGIVQLFSVCGLPLALLDNPMWRNLLMLGERLRSSAGGAGVEFCWESCRRREIVRVSRNIHRPALARANEL
jgi:hypothetical protein